MKAQSAMEYLVTYGWAILIITVVIAVLYSLGIFNVSNFAPNLCSFPADFGCISAALFPTGNLIVNIEQSTANPIYVTAVGCNGAGTTSNMVAISGNGIYLQIGGNSTFSNIPCYTSNSLAWNGPVGTLYTGWVVVNYTDVQTGFKHVISGRLIQKVV